MAPVDAIPEIRVQSTQVGPAMAGSMDPGAPQRRQEDMAVSEDKHVMERETRHGWITNSEDDNLGFSVESDGDVIVEMNPQGQVEGTIRATYSKAQMRELCLWTLKVIGLTPWTKVPIPRERP